MQNQKRTCTEKKSLTKYENKIRVRPVVAYLLWLTGSEFDKDVAIFIELFVVVVCLLFCIRCKFTIYIEFDIYFY